MTEVSHDDRSNCFSHWNNMKMDCIKDIVDRINSLPSLDYLDVRYIQNLTLNRKLFEKNKITFWKMIPLPCRTVSGLMKLHNDSARLFQILITFVWSFMLWACFGWLSDFKLSISENRQHLCYCSKELKSISKKANRVKPLRRELQNRL